MVKLVLNVPVHFLPALEQLLDGMLSEVRQKAKMAAMPKVCSKNDTGYFATLQIAARAAMLLMSNGADEDEAVAEISRCRVHPPREVALAHLKLAMKKEEKRKRVDRTKLIKQMVLSGEDNSTIARRTGLCLSTAARMASQAKKECYPCPSIGS